MRSSLNPHELVSQTASRSVQPFLHSSPVFPNTETDIQTTLRAITLAMGHVYSVSGKNSLLYILHTHAQTRPVLHKIKHAHVQMYLGYCYKMVSRMSVTVLAIQQPGPQGWLRGLEHFARALPHPWRQSPKKKTDWEMAPLWSLTELPTNGGRDCIGISESKGDPSSIRFKRSDCLKRQQLCWLIGFLDGFI